MVRVGRRGLPGLFVPTAFLIDRDGRIVWRGHPGSLETEGEIEKLRARDVK